MKNTIKLKDIQRIAGLIAFAAITGFAMTSCDDGSGGGSKYVIDVESNYGKNGDLNYYYDYEYDSKGNRTKLSYYFGNGDLIVYTVYTYKRV
jgi:hypothetical protein